jgi:hypothetical protein
MASYADAEIPDNPPLAEVSEDDEELLKEIRDRYTYDTDVWKETKDERNTDIRYIAGNPWDAKDKKAREDAGRPCISHDELSQFVNACVNSVRKNKRGIKVDPRGGTSSTQTAEARQDHIRAIEYESNAPAVYLKAFQEMVEGSYAFFRVGRKYVSDDVDSDDPGIFDQEITITSIGNPNSVLFDPHCKQPDWSDAKHCFVLEPMDKTEFKRRFPKAQVTDFSPEHMILAKDWINDKRVLVAEYWKILTTRRKKYLLEDGSTVMDKLPKGAKALQTRTVEKSTVMQYMTNGIEILKRKPQPGKHLGIIPMIGMERYVDDESGVTKRVLFSLIRLARDPQMSLAYLVSQQMEEAGLTPKTPYKGYVGQFETDRQAIEDCTKVPRSFLQFDAITDATGPMVLPLPTRESFTPNFQAYEVAKDSCRRAVQAAVGVSPLPTAAQRDTQKSGVALERMNEQQEVGSFHFVDGFDRAIQLCGRVVDEWYASTYDREDRDVFMRKADESVYPARLNTAKPYPSADGKTMEHYPVDADASHDITVSDGPSVQSQYEAVSDFLDLLIPNLPTLGLSPPQAHKILAISIQMKQLGPKGDQIAEIISPDDAAQAGQQQQQMQQQMMQMQQQGQMLQELQAELQKLQLEKAGHVIDNQFKTAIEKMKIEAQVAAAEINTKAQNLSERMSVFEDLAHKLMDQAHDRGMAAQQAAHDQDAATQQQTHAAGMQSDAQAAAAQQQAAQQQAQPEAAD